MFDWVLNTPLYICIGRGKANVMEQKGQLVVFFFKRNINYTLTLMLSGGSKGNIGMERVKEYCERETCELNLIRMT